MRDSGVNLHNFTRLWNPDFRIQLLSICGIAIASAVISYFVNVSIQAFVLAFSANAGSAAPFASASVNAFSRLAHAASLSAAIPAPVVLAIGFAIVSIADTQMRHYLDWSTKKFEINSADATELAVLRNLVEKGDEFFARNSLSAIAERLAIDVPRTAWMRVAFLNIWSSACLVLAHVYFFWEIDPLLALAALALSIVASMIMLRIGRPILRFDRDHRKEAELVRTKSEDLLRISGEAGLYGTLDTLHARMRRTVEGRRAARIGLEGLRIRLLQTRNLSTVALTLAMVIAVILVAMVQSGPEALVVATIPVIIRAARPVFEACSQFALQFVDLAAARSSAQRLLEYAAPARRRGAIFAPPANSDSPRQSDVDAVEFVAATYTYGDADHAAGVRDLSAKFNRGEWSAIIGPSGSGKSTIVKLLIGQIRPQRGSLKFGSDRPQVDRHDAASARIGYLCQQPILIEADIESNILVGRDRLPRPGAIGQFSEGEVQWLEDIGIGALCRDRALDMLPRMELLDSAAAQSMLKVRRRLSDTASPGEARQETAAAARQYRYSGSGHRIAEALLDGKCPPTAIEGCLTSARGLRLAAQIADSPNGAVFQSIAAAMLEGQRQLLSLESYDLFKALAPAPVGPQAWELRRRFLTETRRRIGTTAAVAIVLTASLAEWPERCGAFADFAARIRHDAPSWLAQVRALLGPGLVAIGSSEIHPLLTWEQNLLFADNAGANANARARLRASIVAAIEAEGLGSFFMGQGLKYTLGRQGASLSGGQGQLVALARAIVRDPDVVVLDEPTSALDPSTRDKVAAALKNLAKTRIVIAVTHDPAIMRHADRLVLLHAGVCVDQGPFEHLSARSAIFKTLLGTG